MEIEPTRQMVEPPQVERVRELSTDDDGEAKQPTPGESWPPRADPGDEDKPE